MEAAIKTNGWGKLLQSALHNECDVIPADCLTAQEVSVKWGLSISRTHELLGKLQREKQIEKITLRRLSPGGRVYPTAHYREAKK